MSFIRNKILLIILLFSTHIAFSQSGDTLKVYQDDTLVFKRTDSWFMRPCSKHGQFSTHYELINPKNDTYYKIYNNEAQLAKEGMYTSIIYQGKKYYGFYNTKNYYYKDNGKLTTIFYQENGRNAKTEYYKRGKLKEVTFFEN